MVEILEVRRRTTKQTSCAYKLKLSRASKLLVTEMDKVR